MLENLFSKILRSEFNKNVLILSGGTALAQLILVAIMPILTRIYEPEAFGALALFLAISAIIGGNITLKFELAIMLAREETEARTVAYLAIILNVVFSFILLVVIVFLFTPITSALNISHKNGYWLYLLPIATFFIGYNAVLLNLNNREKNYKTMAVSAIVKNGTMMVVQLALGVLRLLAGTGLIFGQLAAYFAGNRMLSKKVSFGLSKMAKNKTSVFKNVVKRYKDFPLFAFPAGIANAASLNISNLLISGIYSIGAVGQFSLANKILGAPSVLISQNIAKVYYQTATEQIKTTGNCKKAFLSTLRKLVLIALPVFIPLAIFSEMAFPFVFGQDWMVAGQIAKYMTLLIGIRFVSSSLSVTLNAVEKQRWSLLNNIVLLGTTLAVFVYAKLQALPFIDFIRLYSMVLAVLYFVFLASYYKASMIIIKPILNMTQK